MANLTASEFLALMRAGYSPEDIQKAAFPAEKPAEPEARPAEPEEKEPDPAAETEPEQKTTAEPDKIPDIQKMISEAMAPIIQAQKDLVDQIQDQNRRAMTFTERPEKPVEEMLADFLDPSRNRKENK